MKKHFKMISALFACTICVLSSLLFFGCKNTSPVSTPAINMNRYFSNTVVSRNIDSGATSTTNLTLSSFISESVDKTTLKKHRSLTFDRNGAWLNGMYIECVYFYVYSDTALIDSQLSFLMTGLDGGLYDETLPEGTYKVEKNSIGISVEENGSQLVRVDIGHKVTQNGFSLVFDFDNDLEFGNFSWTIYHLTVYGEIRL
ncbi:MAG: hypothetical protein IJ542_00200 [Clostridia bacterium]|nr:hypothetical protein [Clostridia bacterium]